MACNNADIEKLQASVDELKQTFNDHLRIAVREETDKAMTGVLHKLGIDITTSEGLDEVRENMAFVKSWRLWCTDTKRSVMRAVAIWSAIGAIGLLIYGILHTIQDHIK